MKLTLEKTTKIVEVDGVPARVWEGKSEKGVPVICFITRVAVREDVGPEALADFERELKSQPPMRPSDDANVFPLRMIL